MTCGLSPLARGTHRAGRRRFCRARFIPAGAGNTALRNCKTFLCTVYPRWRPHAPVYPRWRGEHPASGGFKKGTSGLSPLARGTHPKPLPGAAELRFIPAGAGNTKSFLALSCWMTVYPRWRGEHCTMHILENRLCGLSPLARGTRPCSETVMKGHRFIPAGAGNTLSNTVLRAPPAVYPRWRGEHRKGGLILV